MKAGVVVKQLEAADKYAKAGDSFLSGVGSKEELRAALKEYWASKPLPPELPDNVEWHA